MTALEVARNLLFVREKSNQNDGPWVEAIQKVTGNSKGDAWCASFVCFCLMIAMAGKNPLPRTASCDVLLRFARENKLVEAHPVPGDVFLLMNGLEDAVHTGFVTKVGGASFKTLEGNTNPAGGREGYGVFERTRFNAPGKFVFVRVPQA